MAKPVIYRPKYEKSWALVVGINAYVHASRLEYACNDATAVAHQLESRFNFPAENIHILLDEKATREAIVSGLLGMVDKVGIDDRIVVFYAGHGCTRVGQRGEVGFLVPVEADPAKLETLIRWDDFARNAELVPAKHMLFIMDACYGGLAVSRALPPGSTRFVRDMLSRYARQVVTAGKADEPVADSGGPRKGNSMFTGHLLDALEGAVAATDGLISANALMAYVYDRVSKDPHSRQSPHFGFWDGDGDLLLNVPEMISEETKETGDILIKVPAELTVPEETIGLEPLLDQVKEYLSETRHRIRLDDFVIRQLRGVRGRLAESEFPLQTSGVSVDDIVGRLAKYERALSELLPVAVLLGRWANEEQQSAIERVIFDLTDVGGARGGISIWLGMRSYPAMLALYHGGIGAIAGGNYQSLVTLFTTKVSASHTQDNTMSLEFTIEGMQDVGFNKLPGHERHFVPRSEYMFKRAQSTIDDILLLGSRYEYIFDQFEILYALTCADLSDTGWGPTGRFAWKYKSRRDGDNPFVALLANAKLQGDAWPPIRAGLFEGRYERFEAVATRFQTDLLENLQYF